MNTSASIQYEPTAYRGNRKVPESSQPSRQRKAFLRGWTQGSPLEKSSRSGVFPPKVLETWSPEAMVEEEEYRQQFEQEADAGGKPYEPSGWINGQSIRYATLPKVSWALLWMRHGGRVGLSILVPLFSLTFIFGWTQEPDYITFGQFFQDGVLPFILYMFLPLALCWGIGYFLETYYPHIVYRAPKGPQWELNRRTGMVTLFSDPEKDGRAGETIAQASFDEWDGYLLTLPDRQGNVWYRVNLVHKTEEWALPLNQLVPATTNREDVEVFWLMICRYMDVTQPLPDIPLFEPFRHEDPRTVSHDNKKNRNPRYWRDMSSKDYETFKRENRSKLYSQRIA